MAGKGTCKMDGCDAPVRGKGYCERHYRQWKKGRLGKARYRSCGEAGCTRPRSRRGLCEEHFAKTYPGKKASQGGAAEAAAG